MSVSNKELILVLCILVLCEIPHNVFKKEEERIRGWFCPCNFLYMLNVSHVCQPMQVQSQCISMRSLPLLCAKLLGNIRVQELSEISQFFIKMPGFSRKGLPCRMIVITQQIFKITFSVTRIKCIRASQIVCMVLTVHLAYTQKALKIHAQY